MRRRALLLVPLAIVLAGCGPAPQENNHAAPQAAPLPVKTVAVATQRWPVTYEATGNVKARTSTAVSAKLMGYVRDVRVQIGDRVQPGQVLVVLDARDIDVSSRKAEAAREEVRSAIPEADAAVAGAKSSLDLAQSTFNRMNDLWSKKSISNQEFDEASARLRSAQAAYDMARAKRAQLDSKLAQTEQEVRAADVTRSYTEVTAPFAGVVTSKSVEPGILAIPGSPLLTIERDGAFRFEAQVEESQLAAIRTGQRVTVTLDGVDRTVNAQVSEIVPAVDAASRSYIVKIDLPAMPTLRSGLFGRAAFPSGERMAIVIPSGAIRSQGQLQSVWIMDGTVARLRLVTSGKAAAGQTEILSGLSEGERVIFPAPPDLSDGRPVEAVRD